MFSEPTQSLSDAVQKLGLKLERRRIPMEMLTVTHGRADTYGELNKILVSGTLDGLLADSSSLLKPNSERSVLPESPPPN